jgi:hypothetical protein
LSLLVFTILFGELALEVHAIVENSPDLNLAVGRRPIEEEMPGPLNPLRRLPDTVATMPQVIGPYAACNFRSVVATRTLWLLGHVHDGAGEQGLIAKAGLLPELLVRPYEDCLDIRIGLRRQPVSGHRSIAADRARSTLGRPPADLADEIGELLIAFDSGALGAVERGERLGGQAAEHAQYRPEATRLSTN